MDPDMRKTCLITGASRGIGLAIARRLDRHGYRLALTAQSKESWQRLRSELASFTAKDHVPIVCDVAEERQIAAMFAQTDATLGRLDAMVVNAGIHHQGPATEIQAADWDRLFAIDVRGAMLCCREAACRMAAHGGSIVVIGSIAGERPIAQRACYCAAKAAVHAYAQSVALEWARQGIRVNVVAPGPIDTEFLTEALHALKLSSEELLRLIPLGKIGTVEDVAAAVHYLLSDEASFVTGAVLRIDGGRIWS